MRGGLASLTLLLFGAALIKLGVSADLLLYVRPSARPWVLLAGIALVLLASWSIVAQARASGAAPESDDHHEAQEAQEGHDHGRPPRVAWLVLAPVVAVLIIAPPALGEFTANHSPSVNAAATGKKAQLVAGPTAVQLHVLDFLLLSTGDPAALRGRPVTLVGFVQRQDPGQFTLARLVITCCAADASTATVTVSSTAAALTPLAVGGWVQVTGQFDGVSGPDATPRLRASSVQLVNQPKDPYD